MSPRPTYIPKRLSSLLPPLAGRAGVVLLLLTLTALAACSPGDEAAGVAPEPPSDEPQAISFGTGHVEATRGKGDVTDATLPRFMFGLYAAYTGHEDLAADKPLTLYLNNHKYVIPDEATDNVWHGDKPAYWPLDPTEKLTFFPYAPYDATLSQFKVKASPVGTITADFTPGTSVAGHIDLCMAQPIVNTSLKQLREANPGVDNPTLPANFKHALCKVALKAKYTGTLKEMTKVVIEKVEISNVLSHREVSFNTAPSATLPYTWGEASSAAANRVTYTMALNKTELLQLGLRPNLPPDFKNFQHDKGYIYAVPQTHTGGKMTITFSYRNAKSDDKTVETSATGTIITIFSQQMDMPEVEWKDGHVVTYEITIDLGPTTSVSINPVIEPWEDSVNDGGKDDNSDYNDHVML